MIELIAEISSNHGGDRGLMEAFIAEYAAAGADWIKFQSYQVKTLRPNDPQREWLAKAELSDDDHFFLIETCQQYKVKFLTTVFHASRVPFLASLKLETLKIGSGEADEYSITNEAHGLFPRILVSTGLADHFDLDRAWRGFSHNVRLMHCVSRYPHPSVCALAPYGIPQIGYSDHSIGVEGCQIAIVGGARVIEKHVSLPEQKRPIRCWEADSEQFAALRDFANDDPAQYLGRWQHGD